MQQKTEPPPVTVTVNVKPTQASVKTNGTQAKPPAGNQVTATTEKNLPAQSSTPAKDIPKQTESPSVFAKMFQKKNGLVSPVSEANVAAEVAIVSTVHTESEKSVSTSS